MYVGNYDYGGSLGMKLMKKGQEEIVGFVVVVVLVAIVALVMLSFSLRTPQETYDSARLARFIGAVNEYSSNCSLTQDYATIGELYGACYQGVRCSDEVDSCVYLNNTLREIIAVSLQVGEERPLKGYTVHVRYRENTNASKEETILSFGTGNCSTGQRQGSSDIRYARGGVIRSSIATCT